MLCVPHMIEEQLCEYSPASDYMLSLAPEGVSSESWPVLKQYSVGVQCGGGHQQEEKHPH